MTLDTVPEQYACLEQEMPWGDNLPLPDGEIGLTALDNLHVLRQFVLDEEQSDFGVCAEHV